jgi:hypothetical protein
MVLASFAIFFLFAHHFNDVLHSSLCGGKAIVGDIGNESHDTLLWISAVVPTAEDRVECFASLGRKLIVANDVNSLDLEVDWSVLFARKHPDYLALGFDLKVLEERMIFTGFFHVI